MKRTTLIIALLLPFMVQSQITLGVQAGYCDKPSGGITMTATPDRVGIYLAGRFEKTDASGLAGLTIKPFKGESMIYLAGSCTLYDEPVNRIGFGCEVGTLITIKHVYFQFGIGTHELKTLDGIVGIGVKI